MGISMNEFKLVEKKDFSFYSNGSPNTYITGAHYMYLQWSKIDVGVTRF